MEYDQVVQALAANGADHAFHMRRATREMPIAEAWMGLISSSDPGQPFTPRQPGRGLRRGSGQFWRYQRHSQALATRSRCPESPHMGKRSGGVPEVLPVSPQQGP
jgi:hypothetical protein